MDLKAIKVLISTNTSGGALYPEFNKMPSVVDSKMDWAHYVDRRGTGWHYDKCCAHAFDKPGSPMGIQFGMLLVPKEFADDAAANFPATCALMDEMAVEEFYNDHCHAHEQDELVIESVVLGINAKQGAGRALSDTDSKALDPDDPTPGINKNLNKVWADHKVQRNINII